ncbi:MAG: hypothetical protein AAGB29_12100, partial [Planctomycetota bacterium]
MSRWLGRAARGVAAGLAVALVLGAAGAWAQVAGFRAERGGADRWMAADAQRLAVASLAGGEALSEAQVTLAEAWLEQAKALDPGWAEPYR